MQVIVHKSCQATVEFSLAADDSRSSIHDQSTDDGYQKLVFNVFSFLLKDILQTCLLLIIQSANFCDRLACARLLCPLTSPVPHNPSCYRLFTPPTWTIQNCLVLSCLCRRCEHNWRKTRQFCLVSTQFPICTCSVSNILRITENLEIGNWVEHKTTCLQFTPPTRTVRDGGVNRLLVLGVTQCTHS